MNLSNIKIYRAVEFYKYFNPRALYLWRSVLLFAGFISVAAFLAAEFVFPDLGWSGYLPIGSMQWAGIALILIPLGFSILFFEIFYFYLKNPQIDDNKVDVLNFLDFGSALILDRVHLSNGFVSLKNLMLSMLESKVCQSVFLRLIISPEGLKTGLDESTNVNADELFQNANNNRIEHKNNKITPLDLMVALWDLYPYFQQILIKNNLDRKDLNLLAEWYESNGEFLEKRRKFWDLENLLRQSPIGVSWVYAHVPLLERFARPMGRSLAGKDIENYLYGRAKTVKQIEEALLKAQESNVLLVGEPGIGKHTVIVGLAYLISEGKVLPGLSYKRVMELDMAAVISYSKEKSEVQNILVEVLNQAVRAGNIILVIENFHNFVEGKDTLGGADISKVLIPYLESTGIQIIATTDNASYHKHIESRPELLKVFEKISIEEPDNDSVIKIIEEMIPSIESRFNLFFTYPSIKYIVENADRFIQTTPFPEKAISLLNDVISYVQGQERQIVLAQDVDQVISAKTSIPLGNIGEDERAKLLNLEDEMHRDIVGQEEAVRAVSQTMQRLRAGIRSRNKPAGVFLFIGPTGVGKTQTAKILAKTYFGSPEKMIRFDMSEYQNLESIDRFLGSLSINDPGQLPSLVRDHPFSVLLFDEIEKANKNILNLFLQVFDEGRMTDAFGRKVSFEQNIIIATSNAGADVIRDMVNQGIDPAEQREKIIETLISNQFFTPELLNRFDQVVIFHPLTQEQIYEVAGLLIHKLVQSLRDQGYYFAPSKELISYISKEGFDPQFGARPMQRVIKDKVESVIARKILEGEIQKGQEFGLALTDLE